jgi:hypothetical protein
MASINVSFPAAPIERARFEQKFEGLFGKDALKQAKDNGNFEVPADSVVGGSDEVVRALARSGDQGVLDAKDLESLRPLIQVPKTNDGDTLAQKSRLMLERQGRANGTVADTTDLAKAFLDDLKKASEQKQPLDNGICRARLADIGHHLAAAFEGDIKALGFADLKYYQAFVAQFTALSAAVAADPARFGKGAEADVNGGHQAVETGKWARVTLDVLDAVGSSSGDLKALHVDVSRAMELHQPGMVGMGFEGQPSATAGKEGFTVWRVADQSPAKAAGIEPGDHVVALDSRDVSEMPFRDFVKTIHGEAGTSLTVTLIKKGTGKTETVVIKRLDANGK